MYSEKIVLWHFVFHFYKNLNVSVTEKVGEGRERVFIYNMQGWGSRSQEPRTSPGSPLGKVGPQHVDFVLLLFQTNRRKVVRNEGTLT